jgi:hypothetical protein
MLFIVIRLIRTHFERARTAKDKVLRTKILSMRLKTDTGWWSSRKKSRSDSAERSFRSVPARTQRERVLWKLSTATERNYNARP